MIECTAGGTICGALEGSEKAYLNTWNGGDAEAQGLLHGGLPLSP